MPTKKKVEPPSPEPEPDEPEQEPVVEEVPGHYEGHDRR